MSGDSEVEHMHYTKRIPSSSKVRSNSLESFERENIQFRNDLRERKQHRRFLRKCRIARELEEQNTVGKANSIPKLGNYKRKECEERNTTSAIRDLEGRCAVHEIILEGLEKSTTEKLRK